MTVAKSGTGEGELCSVIEEVELEDGEHLVQMDTKSALIAANLKTGANIGSARQLEANSEISCPGVKLHGSGFIATKEKAGQLGLGQKEGIEKHIRGYRNGRDLTSSPRHVMVIDLFGLDSSEVAKNFPSLYQHVANEVKPERDQNNRAAYRDNWWLFGEPRGKFRPALVNLPRYMLTGYTHGNLPEILRSL